MEPKHRISLCRTRTEKAGAYDGKPTKSLIRSTYLIDEEGVIIKAFGSVKASENAVQMLGTLE